MFMSVLVNWDIVYKINRKILKHSIIIEFLQKVKIMGCKKSEIKGGKVLAIIKISKRSKRSFVPAKKNQDARNHNVPPPWQVPALPQAKTC